MNKFKRKIIFFLFIVIGFWISISIFRLFHNMFRLFVEENNLLFVSKEEKREALYGDIYYVVKYIEQNTSETDVTLLLANDGKEYFIARYLLYPRKVHWSFLTDDVNPIKSYKFVIDFHPRDLKTGLSNKYLVTARQAKSGYTIIKNNIKVAEIYE